MFKNYNVPSPRQGFGVDKVLFDELAAAVSEYGDCFNVTLDEPIEPQLYGMEVDIWKLAQPLVKDSIRALGRKASYLGFFADQVEPGTSQLQDLWHNDLGMYRGLVIANIMPTEYAVGKIPRDQRVIIENAKKPRFGRPDPLLNTAVEEAIASGSLRIVQAKPYSAALFTQRHLHRSPVNETDETVERFIVKIAD